MSSGAIRRNEVRIVGDSAYIQVRYKEQVLETIIDADDVGRVLAAGYWYANWSEKWGAYYVFLSGARGLSLHRFIMGFPKNKLVDHKNHNALDSRKGNLRTCTHTQNMQNRRGAHRTSKSGVRGVYWRESHQRWAAEVRANRKKTFLGYFDSVEEAKAVVEQARLYLHGDFAS